jgi:3-phenylpropionate/trans-cinnamate dioxygenase ferredoxin component
MADPEFVAIANVDELPPEGKKLITVAGKPILLCHSDGQIYAVTNICSHAFQELCTGRMRHGWIMCPVHGSRFDLETGEPMNPPATEPITTYPVRIVGDTIEVAV